MKNYKTEIQNNFWKIKVAANQIAPSFLRKSYQQLALNELQIYSSLKEKDILIVGIGKGKEIPTLIKKQSNSITGIEPEPIIEPQTFGKKFNLINAPGEKIPVDSESVDIAYSIATLEHVQDPKKVVQEMVRVLKPGGIFYCQAGPLWYSFQGYHKKRRFPELTEDWLHLIYDKEQLIEKFNLHNSTNYLNQLDKIYESDNYNRIPAKHYYETASWLINHHVPLKVNFKLTYEKLNNLKSNYPEKYELISSKYNHLDLLTNSFTWIFQKDAAALI